MSTLFQGPVPLLNQSDKRLIVLLHPGPVPHQFGVQVIKEGLDDVGWDQVHRILLDAAHVVAREWVGTILRNMMLEQKEWL